MREDGEVMLNPTPPHWDTLPSKTSLMSHQTHPYGNPSGIQKAFPSYTYSFGLSAIAVFKRGKNSKRKVGRAPSGAPCVSKMRKPLITSSLTVTT
jgi:hypothetical protein